MTTTVKWTVWHAAATSAQAVVILMLVVVGCGCGQRDDAKRDLEQDNQNLLNPQVDVYRMPDGFPNILFFCTDQGNGIYSHTRDTDAVIIVEGDQACDPQ